MSQKYSQFSAFLALVKASVRSMLKSPSAVIFSIAFPLVFILVFGFIGDRQMKIAVGVPTHSVDNPLVFPLFTDPSIQVYNDSLSTLQRMFEEGQIQAIIDLKSERQQPEQVTITALTQNKNLAHQIGTILKSQALKANPELEQALAQKLQIHDNLIQSKEFKLIDFILPGQLGFSLLAASVFGTAFTFFHMRQMLVLKRFFATPIRKSIILLSEGTARLLFQIIGALLIILIGRYFFDYTLIRGGITVVNMLIVSALALLVFMSFGFIISGIAKSDSIIPPLANIFTLPQFLLAGTFFSVDALPGWLQILAKLMPLTYFNNALRAIAFEGASIWDVRTELLILILWGIIGYAAAAKLFKWE